MIATSVVMDSITEELESGTLTNVLVSPVSTHAIVLGKTMPIILLTLFQILVWTAILRLQGIMVENVLVVFLYLVLVLLVFTGMGVMAAAVTKRRRSSHAIYSLFLLVFVYYTFVGGSYAEYSPANVITAIISNPVVLPAVWGRIALMAALAVVVYGGSFPIFRRSVIN
jgi:ABC-type Na+ efflux pump permease subunit